MRRGVFLAVAGVVALAHPVASSGTHVPIRLTLLKDVFELSAENLDGGSPDLDVARISPPGAAAGSGSAAFYCANEPGECGGGRMSAEIAGDIVRLPLARTGRYKLYAVGVSGYHAHLSNVVQFDVVDPCRFTGQVKGTRIWPPPMPGAPVICLGRGNGSVDLRSTDGSRLRMSGTIGWWLRPGSRFGLPMDVLQLEGERTGPVIHFSWGPNFGRFLTRIRTAGAEVVTYGPAEVQIRHASKITTVSVKRGFAVGYRERKYPLEHHIRRRCGGRPTAKCLSTIRYVVGGWRKRVERAKVIRPGQTAQFKYRGV